MRKPNHPHVPIALMGLLYWIVANCGLSGFHSHQVLPDSDDSPDDGTVEAMNHCPGKGVVGCQDPRAELPTEFAVEAPEERLVSATDVPQRPRGRG